MRNAYREGQVQGLPEDLKAYKHDAFQILTPDECIGIAAWLAFIALLADMAGLLS